MTIRLSRSAPVRIPTKCRFPVDRNLIARQERGVIPALRMALSAAVARGDEQLAKALTREVAIASKTSGDDANCIITPALILKGNFKNTRQV